VSAINHKAILRQLDLVLHRLSQVKRLGSAADYDWVVEVNTRILAAIDRFAPPGSEYRRVANQMQKDCGGNLKPLMGRLGGILRALRDDYATGSMQSLQELVHAELFSDFLDMAEHLLDQGYKDAAAVMTGSVLEEHLRKLCTKNGIAITFLTPQKDTKPKKLDTMNADLAKNKVYSQSDQKLVTAWAAIRNSAAHGKYNDYSTGKVDLMIRGLRNFISGLPA